ADLPEVPELAVIFTPAAIVPGIVQECGQKGIKRLIIETGGFRELDPARRGLEDQIVQAAQEYGIRFMGPNGIGTISTHSKLAVPFPLLTQPAPTGGISVMAQSGGIGLTYLQNCIQERMGIAKFASVGNKLNVNEEDLLEYLIQDDLTEVILLYLESIVAGRRLFELIRSTDKPVVVHKSNIAETSHTIAQSHTAALTNDDMVVEAALRQAGAIRSHTVSETTTILKGLQLPRAKGRDIILISRSGGHAVVAADAVHRENLNLPELPQSYLHSFDEHLRASVIKLQNPLDLGDLFDFEVYIDVLEGALKLDGVQGVVMVHGYRGPETETSRQFIIKAGELCQQYQKPVSMCVLSGLHEVEQVRKLTNIPLFPAPEEAVTALARAVINPSDSNQELSAPPDFNLEQASRILETGNGQSELELPEALHLVAAAGVPVAPWTTAMDADDAVSAAEHLGYPVVLKAVGVSHKTEAQGVVLNLKTQKAVNRAASAMIKRLGVKRLVVMKQVPSVAEVIVGIKQDPAFGPMLLFGLGGVTAEVLEDVSLRLAPVSQKEAGQMLEEIRGSALLKGYRGRPACSLEALADAVQRIGWLSHALPRIAELDINPLMAGPEGVVAVDARVGLTKASK
ncbi:MAG: acetate--CoA ligase family protein, partial [Desulfarculaceae bacterium]